jgi:hypothetical protein
MPNAAHTDVVAIVFSAGSYRQQARNSPGGRSGETTTAAAIHNYRSHALSRDSTRARNMLAFQAR